MHTESIILRGAKKQQQKTNKQKKNNKKKTKKQQQQKTLFINILQHKLKDPFKRGVCHQSIHTLETSLITKTRLLKYTLKI